MKTILLILTSVVLFMSVGCEKEELVNTWVQGTVVNGDDQTYIPDALIYLMSNDKPFTGGFSDWEYVDSMLTDSEGYFRFDYQARENTRYGVYPKKEHFFDYRQVQFQSRSQKEAGIKPPLFPKAYLEIRVQDEPPYSGINSMHIDTPFGQETIEIKGDPIDTTVIRWLHPPSELYGWFYHLDTGWSEPFGAYATCSQFDTCYHEIVF